MTDILFGNHRATLASFASSNVVVAFDYDGTLAPLVSRPEHARMRARTRNLLAQVARRYPCVIISGRALADLAPRLRRIPVWHLSGNHGVEPWEPRPSFAARVRSWVKELSPRLDGHPGIAIENKRFSLTVHYRRTRRRREALETILNAVGSLPEARTIAGELAVSVLPREAPGKGVALDRVRRALGCDKVIYVGDDETDEDAFASAAPESLLAIRIGAEGRSRARYRLKDQRHIDAFLAALLACRPVGRRTAHAAAPSGGRRRRSAGRRRVLFGGSP
ncbi:MAG TPA: trehalose-phosphatase [Vicinamibacterales bacterium]|jgi:trehalose 6-phosphate phosphatase